MFAIVTAEATRRVLVPDIIWVAGPIGFLLRVYTVQISLLYLSDSAVNQGFILGVKIRIIDLVIA